MRPKLYSLGIITAISAVTLLTISTTNSCKNTKDDNNKNSTFNFRYIPTDTTKLVVWLKPGASKDDIEEWFRKFSYDFGKIDRTIYCQECDSALMLLSGPGVVNYVSGQTASGGSGGRSGPSGEDGPVYYSIDFPVNFIIDSPMVDTPITVKTLNLSATLNDVTVAVFDTGDDPRHIDNTKFYVIPFTPCLGADATTGWNFAENNNQWQLDDYPSKHGTVVTNFIINQVNSYAKNGVKILPVKIHDKYGKSNLFKVLCGLAYAQKSGAQIINASFGFYAPKYYYTGTGERYQDSSATLLKEFVKHYLTNNGILLIAAAGNKDDANEHKVYNPVNPSDLRNLDSVNFYPASLAEDKECKNVIAVTTANIAGQVSPNQNFSRNVVDVCVYADRSVDFAFQNPILPRKSVIGSSFATPIVTGNICANYYLIQDLLQTNVYDKNQLFEILKNNNISGTNDAFDQKIIGSKVMSRYKIDSNGMPIR